MGLDHDCMCRMGQGASVLVEGIARSPIRTAPLAQEVLEPCSYGGVPMGPHSTCPHHL